MVAAKYDFTIEQGSDFTFGLTFPSTVSLTNATANMDIRSSVSASTAILQLATTGSAPRLSITGQVLTCALPASVTTAITSDISGVYDLEVTFPSGSKQRFIEGNVTISKEVTK